MTVDKQQMYRDALQQVEDALAIVDYIDDTRRRDRERDALIRRRDALCRQILPRDMFGVVHNG